MRGDRGWSESYWAEARRRRYARDIRLFFSECIQIPLPGAAKGRVPFELFDYQDDTLSTVEAERRVLILKARQLGLTTLLTAFALHHLLFTPGANVLLVSRNQDVADSALELMDFMWRFLPPWLVSVLPAQTSAASREHEWTWGDGMKSRIVSLPPTKKTGASAAATLVLWDESALADLQAEVYRSLDPTTDATGGKMIVFSTARGAHNWYAKTWRRSVQGEASFVTVFHPWYVSRFMNPLAERLRSCDEGPCPECIDRTRYLEKQQDYVDEPWNFYAEYPETAGQAFRKSGSPRFADLPAIEDFPEWEWQGTVVREREDDHGRKLPAELVALDGGPLLMREWGLTPPGGADVVIAVDPASGNAGDYTVATVGWLDADGLPVVAGIWRSNLTESFEVARDLNALGRLLGQDKQALIVVEKAGGHGETLIHELRQSGYTHLYVHHYTGHRRYRVESTYGFPMTKTQRPLVIDRLAEWLPKRGDAGNGIYGLGPVHWHELGGFVRREDGRVAADVGMHDDAVMSLAIWTFVVTERSKMPAPAQGPDPDEGKPGAAFTMDLSHIIQDEVARDAERRREGSKQMSRLLRRSRSRRRRVARRSA